MASLTTAPNSPFWLARMRVWVAAPEHPAGGFWRQTCRSTKLPLSTPKRKAKRVADEMEMTARELRDQMPDSAWASSRIEALVRAAGLPSPRRKTAWEKAAEGWLKAKTAKPRSLEAYTSHVAHFARFLGARARHDLRSITPDDISEFYHGLIKRGLSARSAQQITKSVRAVFSRAALLQQIDTNPAALLRMGGCAAPATRKPFTDEDIAAIFRAAGAEWRIACLFGLYYGMRIGDATRRKLDEINNGVLRFLPEKKSRRGKVVSVPLVGELSKLRPGTGCITPTLAKMSSSVASRHFSRLLDSAGVRRVKIKGRGHGRGITDKGFHSWRHTTNSLLVNAGVDQRLRQLICDHDDTRTSNQYTHASIETMAKALAKAIPQPSKTTALPESASRPETRTPRRKASPRGRSTP